MITFVGSDKIDVSKTISAHFMNLEGKTISQLSLKKQGNIDTLKYSASFMPPIEDFRLMVTGTF